MGSHINPLQDIVRLTIRQELEWGEWRLKRITMSEDAAGKPAELYGADGKIYYRKAGGAGAEIGTGAGELWESPGGATRLVTPEPVHLENNLELEYDQIIQFECSVPSETVGQIYGFNGAVQRDFMVKSLNSGILTLDSSAGYIACSGDRLSDVGTPLAAGDAVMVDTSIHVPLAQLPLTSKGTVFAGNGTAAGVLAIATNGDVLTLDSSAALGVKWAAGAEGVYLPLSAGETKPLTGDLYMGGNDIINLVSLTGTYNSTSTYDELSIRNQADDYDIAKFSYKVIDELAVADLDMLGHHIAGLPVADSNGHAVEYSQLSGYALESWVSANFNNYVHPSVPPCRAATAAQTGHATAAQITKLDGIDTSLYLPLAGGVMASESGEINMNDSPLTNVGGITMTDAITMGGYDLTNLGSRYGKLDTLQQWYYVSTGGGAVEMLRLNSSSFILLCGMNANNNDVRSVKTIKGYSTNNLSFWDDATGTKTLSQLAAVADTTKILNAAGTTSVECKAGGDIDIIVPSGNVVTFIRS